MLIGWQSKPFRRLAADRRGAVAIESALAFGALIVVAVFLVDAIRLTAAIARLDRVAATTANLAARVDTLVDETDFTSVSRNDAVATFFLAGNQVGQPDDLAKDGRIILSAVRANPDGSFTLQWQRTSAGYGFVATSRLDTPPPLPTGGNFIASEAFLRFKPLILDRLGLLDETSLVLYARAFFRPRTGSLDQLAPAGS